MRNQKVGAAEAPKKLGVGKRRELCTEWGRLEDERADFASKASARKKAMDAIEEQLEPQLAVDGVDLVDVGKYEFGTELVDASPKYKDYLEAEIGLEEIERRVAALPQRAKFFIRDKTVATTKRRKAA